MPTPTERQELADIQQYLLGHAKAGTLDRIPEGSVNAVLNKASLNVRAHIKANQEFAEHVLQGGRSEPFQPRLEIDPSRIDRATEAIAAQSRTEDLSHALMSRMGTYTPEPSGPPDLRETLTAAFDTATPNQE